MTLRFSLFAAPVVIGAGAFAVERWPVEVVAAPVTTQGVVAEVLGVGALESAREVRVSFEASGRVTSLAVDEGDRVEEGQILGTLDVADAARELAAAVASESAAAASVTRARADLTRAEASAARAHGDRARSDQLLAGAVIAAADHDAALEHEATSRAEVDALRAAVQQAEHTRQVATTTRSIRAAQLADGHLRSPLAGLVVTRAAEVGQLVTPGTPAFTIISTERMQVSAWVDEAALGRLAVGQPARLQFRSDPTHDHAGTLARIGREVDRATHELLVDIDVLTLPDTFAVGQRVDAWIQLDRKDAVLTVPRGWCTDTCFVVEDGRVATRSVTLGLGGRERVEVREGLYAGERVLAPTAPIGRRVSPVEAP